MVWKYVIENKLNIAETKLIQIKHTVDEKLLMTEYAWSKTSYLHQIVISTSTTTTAEHCSIWNV